MTIFLPALLFIAASAVAIPDETIARYAGPGDWRLVEMNGAPVIPRAVIRFGRAGEVTGQAPCNSYRSTQNAPYPWISFDPIVATRLACPDLQIEVAFLEALQSVRYAEVLGDVLILTDAAGAELVFHAD